MDAEAERSAQVADRILRESNAILTGDHFVYVTGEHGDGWIDKDAIFPYLTEVKIPSWPADECRLCSEGVPINTRYAHGADFLAAQRH